MDLLAWRMNQLMRNIVAARKAALAIAEIQPSSSGPGTEKRPYDPVRDV